MIFNEWASKEREMREERERKEKERELSQTRATA